MKTMRLVVLASLVLSSFGIQAQKYGATPADSLDCLRNLSVYQEFYKQRNYNDAFESWYQVYKICPQASMNTFIRGSVMLKSMIAQEKDPQKKEQYINILIQSWDVRAESFGNPGLCYGKKGVDQMEYHPEKARENYELFMESFKYGAGDDPTIPFFMLQSAIALSKEENLGGEFIITAYEQATAELERMQKAKPEDTTIAGSLVSVDLLFQPYASCEQLVALFEKSFEANKDNKDRLSKSARLLGFKDCTDSDIFFKISSRLYELDPNAESAYLLAKICVNKKQYSKAIEYLKDQAEKIENDKDRFNAYMTLTAAYTSLERFSEARSSALRATDIMPNEGMPYILIGNMYAQSAKNCGDNAEVGQKAAFWAAVDKYQKAKTVDPSIAEMANKLIATYSSHFPSGDDLFFHGIDEGSSYRIGCWINESTVVRARR